MKINVNDQCKFKLTAYGKRVADECNVNRFLDLNHSWSLWELMNVFGPYMFNGADQIFERNELEIVTCQI